MIRFDQTPPPSPSWDRHLDTTSRLTLAMLGGRPTVVQRDLGDETDEETLNDGLEVME